MTQILVVEDDKNIAELVTINLQDDLTKVTCCYDGAEGYVEASKSDYDLIILDLMLPGKKGMDICRDLRLNHIQTPILMLTSKSDEIDKILGLESGADDYITKPFSVRELQARVRAVLRRSRSDRTNSEPSTDGLEITVKNLKINQELRKVQLNGKRLNLTPKEFELLLLLANNPGKTYSRAQLLHNIWGYEFEGYEHTVNSHINRLRSKLEKDPSNPEFILTSWGVGYRFTE
ncbi:response regulator transcription factor [Aegicerativicinus sediminis]|uniref:response regulator transcription factor n=1 Tax=Aegicerativicinus sediminis TaxID=2893202 RepID=UPI001E5C712C|nr:response regulator transcription factor [Aegicerativicinus sediminis]